MRRPYFSLSKSVQYYPPKGGPDVLVEFQAGTLIFPIWNEGFLPSHQKQFLNDSQRTLARLMHSKDKLVMCIIGKYWIPVAKNSIKENK